MASRDPQLKLSTDRLVRLGYRGLTREQLDELLREMVSAAREIVGMNISGLMTAAQLDEFDQLYDASDEVGMSEWLQRTVPNHGQIVRDTFAQLDEILRSTAEDFTRRSEIDKLEPPVLKD